MCSNGIPGVQVFRSLTVQSGHLHHNALLLVTNTTQKIKKLPLAYTFAAFKIVHRAKTFG